MANTAQAKKRARQAEAHRAQNTAQRTLLRTQIKKVRAAIAGQDKEVARQSLQSATSIIDRMAGKGLIHKNAAARYKSRLNQRIRAIGQ